ncbi:MAG TPA: hypothetical protein PLY36_07405 [Spirochaetota bacterium]|nr:hypothetical protein [Spirochaetota bacterium]
MKTNSCYFSGTYSRIILLQLIFIIAALLATACYTDKKISTTTLEMIVIFKADVPVEKANSILFEKEYIYHEGMDSSKGKKYFQETGPKFIVQVPKDKVETFNLEMKNIPQIYEIYQADWTETKD